MTDPSPAPPPRKWGWVVLLTTSTTLVCCVIPIILVSLGMGAAVASLYGNLPFLTFIGMHENATLALTATILLLAGWVLYRPGRTCPVDPLLAEQCRRADRWNRLLFFASGLMWLVGLFFAKLLLPTARAFGLM